MDWQRFGTERRWASDGGMMCIYNCIFVIPVVPHKAVAEVSRIGNV